MSRAKISTFSKVLEVLLGLRLVLGYTGVQSINNIYAIVNKVENVLVNTHIFDLIDIGVYVVYALYSNINVNLLFVL
jgi:hypothetical protein